MIETVMTTDDNSTFKINVQFVPERLKRLTEELGMLNSVCRKRGFWTQVLTYFFRLTEV